MSKKNIYWQQISTDDESICSHYILYRAGIDVLAHLYTKQEQDMVIFGYHLGGNMTWYPAAKVPHEWYTEETTSISATQAYVLTRVLGNALIERSNIQLLINELENAVEEMIGV